MHSTEVSDVVDEYQQTQYEWMSMPSEQHDGYFLRAARDPSYHSSACWTLSILGPERVRESGRLVNSLEVEAWGDVTEAALGLRLMVDYFPCQGGSLFPEPGRMRERIEASVAVLETRGESTIYDVMQRAKRVRCSWKGYAQEVLTAADGWRRRANTLDLGWPQHAQQAHREEMTERMASGSLCLRRFLLPSRLRPQG